MALMCRFMWLPCAMSSCLTDTPLTVHPLPRVAHTPTNSSTLARSLARPSARSRSLVHSPFGPHTHTPTPPTRHPHTHHHSPAQLLPDLPQVSSDGQLGPTLRALYNAVIILDPHYLARYHHRCHRSAVCGLHHAARYCANRRTFASLCPNWVFSYDSDSCKPAEFLGSLNEFIDRTDGDIERVCNKYYQGKAVAHIIDRSTGSRDTSPCAAIPLLLPASRHVRPVPPIPLNLPFSTGENAFDHA